MFSIISFTKIVNGFNNFVKSIVMGFLYFEVDELANYFEIIL